MKKVQMMNLEDPSWETSGPWTAAQQTPGPWVPSLDPWTLPGGLTPRKSSSMPRAPMGSETALESLPYLKKLSVSGTSTRASSSL